MITPLATADDVAAVRAAVKSKTAASAAKAVSVTWAGARWFTQYCLVLWKHQRPSLRRASASSQLAPDLVASIRRVVFMRVRGFRILNMGELAQIAREQQHAERAERAARRVHPAAGQLTLQAVAAPRDGNAEDPGSSSSPAPASRPRPHSDRALSFPTAVTHIFPPQQRSRRRRRVDRVMLPPSATRRKRGKAQRRPDSAFWARTHALRRALAEALARLRAHRAGFHFRWAAHRERRGRTAARSAGLHPAALSGWGEVIREESNERSSVVAHESRMAFVAHMHRRSVAEHIHAGRTRLRANGISRFSSRAARMHASAFFGGIL